MRSTQQRRGIGMREQSPQPSFNAFAARALGHGEKDVGTALSYQQFYVVGASRTFDRAYRRANVQSAALLDAEARTEGDDRRRSFIEENAYRFRAAAGVEAPSIDLPDSKKAADVTDATEQTDALHIQLAKGPECVSRRAKSVRSLLGRLWSAQAAPRTFMPSRS